jgi:hypothetical protein
VWPDRFADFFNSLPFFVRLPIGILGGFSALGILTLWIGMIVDCLVSRKMSVLSKLGWLLALVLTNILGALIYYYAVFNKQGTLKAHDAATMPL